MTIPGIDVTTAATLIATIGRIDRFASPRDLVGYLGLDLRSRQSGLGAVQHGHISKQGSATARHVLCEAAHATMRSPARCARSDNASAHAATTRPVTVAVARKLACLTWQLLTHQQDYIYERPALTLRKLRQLELAAGAPKRHNPRGSPRTGDTRHPRTMGDRTPSRLARRGALPCRRRRWKSQRPSTPNT